MTRDAEATPTCSAALRHAFDVLGKRWNGMIIEVLGVRPLSYVEVRRGVGGISDAMLSVRLGELVVAGLVTRTVIEGPPLAVSYGLTEAGARLKPILGELAEWARGSLTPPAASVAR